MLKIAICEDNAQYRDILTEYVNLLIYENKLNAKVILCSDDYDEFNLLISREKANLYILDVDLGELNVDKNGISLAESIRSISNDAYILFLTGKTVNMNKVFEVKAYNLLKKPINLDYLGSQILLIYKELLTKEESSERNIDIHSCDDHKIYITKCSKIQYVEKADDRCLIHLDDDKIIKTDITLKQIEIMCNNKLFRVHKSFLCNFKYIDSIDKKLNKITMKNGSNVFIGGKYKKNFNNSRELNSE